MNEDEIAARAGTFAKPLHGRSCTRQVLIDGDKPIGFRAVRCCLTVAATEVNKEWAQHEAQRSWAWIRRHGVRSSHNRCPAAQVPHRVAIRQRQLSIVVA